MGRSLPCVTGGGKGRTGGEVHGRVVHGRGMGKGGDGEGEKGVNVCII